LHDAKGTTKETGANNQTHPVHFVRKKGPQMKYVYPIIPASSGPIWIFIAITVFMFCIAALFGYLAFSSRHVRLEVTEGELRIRGDICGRTVPATSVVVDEVKALNLTHDTAYGLKWRTYGAGLPGYSSGWFRLMNGEKALVYVTDPTRIIYIPTRDGYSVLMSVAEPEKVKERLQKSLAKE
jgi:hypothetical protein